MQIRKLVPLLVALMALGTAPAFSADAIGRITYIYPDGHQLVLDSSTDYRLAPGVDASKMGVASFVRLTVTNGQVTRIVPGPAALAGSWTGSGARS